MSAAGFRVVMVRIVISSLTGYVDDRGLYQAVVTDFTDVYFHNKPYF